MFQQLSTADPHFSRFRVSTARHIKFLRNASVDIVAFKGNVQCSDANQREYTDDNSDSRRRVSDWNHAEQDHECCNAVD